MKIMPRSGIPWWHASCSLSVCIISFPCLAQHKVLLQNYSGAAHAFCTAELLDNINKEQWEQKSEVKTSFLAGHQSAEESDTLTSGSQSLAYLAKKLSFNTTGRHGNQGDVARKNKEVKMEIFTNLISGCGGVCSSALQPVHRKAFWCLQVIQHSQNRDRVGTGQKVVSKCIAHHLLCILSLLLCFLSFSALLNSPHLNPWTLPFSNSLLHPLEGEWANICVVPNCLLGQSTTAALEEERNKSSSLTAGNPPGRLVPPGCTSACVSCGHRR